MRSANSARIYDVMQILIQYIIPTSKDYKIKAAHEILFIIESCTAIDFFIPLFLSAIHISVLVGNYHLVSCVELLYYYYIIQKPCIVDSHYSFSAEILSYKMD